IMSSFVIPVLADSADESVGSSTSLIILSDSDSDATVVPTIAPETIPEIKAPVATPPTSTLDPTL
ncbi:hypothetical protein Tco_0696150, partial [Tanacetum coccineum]